MGTWGSLRNWVRAVVVAMLVVLLGISPGCVSTAPLPDPGPLAVASAACQDAAVLAGREVGSLVRASPGGDVLARRFARAWDARIAVVRALTEYTDDLRAIIERADAAEARAQALADRVGRLAAAAGFVTPSGSALPVASSAVAMLWGQVERARAADSLAGALAEADAALRLITTKLAEDREDLDLLIALAADAQAAEIEDESDVRTLASFREDLRVAGAGLIALGESAMTQADRSRLVELAGLLAATEPTWAAIAARLSEVDRRRAAALLVVDRLGDAFQAWGDAHEAFARAVGEGRADTDLETLHDATRHLVEAARAMREHRGNR
jgi:hypothetical protein